MKDEKLRKYITQSEAVLKWTKNNITPLMGEKYEIYNQSITALILLEEIKEELMKKDPFSSKKFKQTKIKFK